jgi:hypothetical protein
MTIEEAKKELKIEESSLSEQVINDSFNRLYNDINHRLTNAINTVTKQDYELKLYAIKEAKTILLSSLNSSIDISTIPSRESNLRPIQENEVSENKSGTILGQEQNYEKLNKYFFGLMIVGIAAASYFGIKMNNIKKELEKIKPEAVKNEKIVKALVINSEELSIVNMNEFAISVSEMNVLLMVNDSTFDVKSFDSKSVDGSQGIINSKKDWSPTYKEKDQNKSITNWVQVNLVGVSSDNDQCYSKTYNAKDISGGKIKLDFNNK